MCAGVLHWELDASKHENDPALDKIRADRGYSYQVRGCVGGGVLAFSECVHTNRTAVACSNLLHTLARHRGGGVRVVV